MKLTSRISHWYFSKRTLPYWGVMLFELAIVLFAEIAVCYFEDAIRIGNSSSLSSLVCTGLGLLCYLISFSLYGTHKGMLRYSSIHDIQRVVLATATATVLLYGVSYLLGATLIDGRAIRLPRLLHCILVFIIVTMLIIMERISVKSLFASFRQRNDMVNVFIYGVREGGVSIAESIQNQDPQRYRIVGFVSPFGDLKTKYLMGVKVRRDGPNLIRHMQDERTNAIIISPNQIEHFRRRRELIDALLENNIDILINSEAEQWDGKSSLSSEKLHKVDIEDLLPRAQIEVNLDAISEQLRDKCILITGAAGSIGSEIVTQVASFRPAQLVLIDQAETPMHNVMLLMTQRYPDIKCQYVVSSITNAEHMERIFAEYRPQYVFHAAAYKHVPMMEFEPAVAVQNNIYGTRVVADLAVKYGALKFVMVSTDKAVNPTNVMGCSKRICEIYCQSLNSAIANGHVEGQTQFVTTRFGNVLGSNGSVIPLFKKQIAAGGPITVTHPDIIRFFMLIPEACKLVLEAATMGHGGEIFVFDMGDPVRIVDLARRMIHLSGAKGIDITFTGLRDGEKLYEEVLAEQENTLPTNNPKIKIARVREYDYTTALANEERLLQLARTASDLEIVGMMKQIVPEFKSRNSKYEVLDK